MVLDDSYRINFYLADQKTLTRHHTNRCNTRNSFQTPHIANLRSQFLGICSRMSLLTLQTRCPLPAWVILIPQRCVENSQAFIHFIRQRCRRLPMMLMMMVWRWLHILKFVFGGDKEKNTTPSIRNRVAAPQRNEWIKVPCAWNSAFFILLFIEGKCAARGNVCRVYAGSMLYFGGAKKSNFIPKGPQILIKARKILIPFWVALWIPFHSSAVVEFLLNFYYYGTRRQILG